jgi:transmembrane sensor
MFDPAKDEAIYWFARLRAPEVSDDDHSQFAAWLASSPHHAEAWERVTRLWHDPAFLKAIQARHLHQTKPLTGHKPQIHGAWPQGYASVLWAGAALASVLLVYSLRLDIWLMADLQNGAGPPVTVQLPDGSRLTLDANSALATDFDVETRGVELLKGRAYFEVRRNPAVPFTVDAPYAEVRVLGTQFLVDAGPSASLVAVREGHVGVTSATSASYTQVLETGFEILANRGGLSTAAAAADDRFEWTDRRIRVRSRPLGEVIDVLTQYQQGLIYVLGEELAAVRVSGSFDLGDPTGAIFTLAESAGARVVGYPEIFLIVQRP